MSYMKTQTTKYQVQQLGIDMFVYDERFRKAREGSRYKMKSCHKCNKKFNDGEKITLAITNKGNKVLCKSCANFLADQDPEIIVHRR